MVKLVVRSQSWQCSHAHTVGKEDLGSSINPGVALKELAPVNMDIVGKTINSAFQSESTEEEDEHDKVGEESSEPDDLARRVETLGNDEVNTDPGNQKTSHKLPLNSSKSVFKSPILL